MYECAKYKFITEKKKITLIVHVDKRTMMITECVGAVIRLLFPGRTTI